jgi:hypothetical protein
MTGHAQIHDLREVARRANEWLAVQGQASGAGSGVNVKYLISSSLVISGNDRSCSSCSSENIFSDTSHPSARPVETGSERSGSDHQSTNQALHLDIAAGRGYIRPKLRQRYRDPPKAATRATRTG